MKKYVYINADTNDGDYVSTFLVVETTNYGPCKGMSVEDQVLLIKKAAKIIKNGGGEYGSGEMRGSSNDPEILYVGENLLSSEELERFDYFVPYGIHTIEDIKIISGTEEECYL